MDYIIRRNIIVNLLQKIIEEVSSIQQQIINTQIAH